MSKRKTVRELPFDERAKRLAAQRRKMQKTLRLFAKQYTAHLAEVEDLLLDVAAGASLALNAMVRKRTKTLLKAAPTPPDGKGSMFGKNETWRDVLGKLEKGKDNPNRAV